MTKMARLLLVKRAIIIHWSASGMIKATLPPQKKERCLCYSVKLLRLNIGTGAAINITGLVNAAPVIPASVHEKKLSASGAESAILFYAPLRD